jgi:hypothetical protein
MQAPDKADTRQYQRLFFESWRKSAIAMGLF